MQTICSGKLGIKREPKLSRRGDLERSRWELAAESVVVKLRWFGVVMGYILVQTRTGLHDPWAVRAFLALGAGYAALDLAFWWMGRCSSAALAASLSPSMESVFILAALLSRHRLEQPLPLVLPALVDLLLDPLSHGGRVVDGRVSQPQLALPGPCLGRLHRSGNRACLLTLTIMVWVTWASSSLA